ncbi:MAG: glucuronate isomerase, partial [Limisphaerales bacterium]
FIGMITDSRSFMSYPRHEYFRRTLCNLIGRDVENGLIPDDEKLTGPIIRNICYANAEQYMAFPVGETTTTRRRLPVYAK